MHYYLVVLVRSPKHSSQLTWLREWIHVSKSTIVFVAENYTHTLCLGLCALSDQKREDIREQEMCSFLSPQTGTFYDENFQSLKPHKSFLQLPHFIMRSALLYLHAI